MTSGPTAAFLIIGNEILSGRTREGNLPTLAAGLGTRGIGIAEVRVVRDETQEIIAALNELRASFNYVFTSGGLGPTHDDITSAAVAEAFAVPIIRHVDAVRVLAAHYKRLELPFNEARRTMADVPEGATLVPNPISAAPGFQLQNVFAFAGVPDIFHAMLEAVLPQLVEGTVVLSRSLRTGLPEGVVADALRELQAEHLPVEMGSYPRMEGVRWATTLVLRSTDPTALTAAFDAAHALVLSLGGTPSEE